jgi:hypothetical protein
MPIFAVCKFIIMKKLLILFIIIFAAIDNFGQFSLGPKIGYTTSKLSTDFDAIKESAKNNFQAGVFFRFGKKFYVQPEVYYSTSGGTLKVSDSTGSVLKGEIKLQNLSVAAFAGYKLINSKKFNLRILAGPVANFILDKTVDFDETFPDPIEESDLSNVAWGIDVGAGVDIFFVTLDVRYEFGLNDLYDPGSEKINSNVFIVSLGFKIF